jgi:hypothetical protein
VKYLNNTVLPITVQRFLMSHIARLAFILSNGCGVLDFNIVKFPQITAGLPLNTLIALILFFCNNERLVVSKLYYNSTILLNTPCYYPATASHFEKFLLVLAIAYGITHVGGNHTNFPDI